MSKQDPTDDALESQLLLNRILELGIKPHAEAIATITATGAVAVVVHQPSALARDAATRLGWDGRAPAFELRPGPARDALAKSDHVTGAWLNRDAPGVHRLLVIAQSGTLLVNFTPGAGYALEPRSTTRAVAN